MSPRRTVTGDATLNVTVTLAGEPCVPEDVTVTCPVYVPGDRFPVVAVSATDCGALPLVGEAESHVWSVATEKLSVPLPAFVMLTFCDDGLAPPCVALNDTAAGEIARMG